MQIMRTIRMGTYIWLIASGTTLGQSATVVATEDSLEIRAANSHLFVQYNNQNSFDQMIDEASSQTADKDIVFVSGPKIHHFEKDPRDASHEAYLMSAAANSDLIVIGAPTAASSDFTEGHHFLFSDYTVAVREVLYSNKVNVLPGQNIVVSRPGGSMQYRGKKIAASVIGFPFFQLNAPYVFFLRFLPNGSFIVFAESAFRVDTESVTTHPGQRNDAKAIANRAFMEDVYKAVERLKDGGR